MAKKTNSETSTATSRKFRDIDSIMKDPAARAILTNLVDEAVACKSEIAKQQQNIKILREDALEQLQVSPKLFNAYVSAAFNNDYSNRKESLDEQVTLLDHIMGLIGYQDPNK
jgi:hypothetical protein